MDARSTVQWIIVVFVVVVVVSFPVFAGPVYTYGGEFNLPILDPPGPGSLMTTATIEVTNTLIIADLDVHIDITHTSVFDLQLFVQSPVGTRICLNMYNFTEFFEGADYTHTIFDDGADVPIEEGRPPFTGRFRPKSVDPLNRLEIFEGENAYGIWQLQIYDMWPADTGTLDRFELVVTIPEPATAMLFILGACLAHLFKPYRGR